MPDQPPPSGPACAAAPVIPPAAAHDQPCPPDEAHLADWLRFTLTPGLGPMKGQQLLRHLGPPADILRSGRSQLARLAGERLADALLASDSRRERQMTRTLAWLAEGQGRRHLLALDDPAYPPGLLHLSDPPLLLYAEGSLTALTADATATSPSDHARATIPGASTQPAEQAAPDPDSSAAARSPQTATLAIVGSRNASPEGLRNAFAFAEALARRGLLIASGLAEGIDSAAHQGALAGADASHPATLAVIGNGLDHIYPAHHRPIARQIIERHGLILGEQPLDAAPLPGNFPRRNRMIAALSQGVLVIEAALKSGSLITARLANELGREVMAIPGSIHNPLAHGCHALLRDGATLVETVDDVLQALGLLPLAPARGNAACRPHRPGSRRGPARPDGRITEPPDEPSTPAGATGHPACPAPRAAPDEPPADESTRQLLGCLQGSPQSAEALARQLGWPIERLLGCIQRAEIIGLVSRHVDGRWQRLPR